MKSFFLTFSTFCLLSLSIVPQSRAADNRPNILWIYLEDVSGWFSCYGDKVVETPNIDALAASGIRFDRFYTPAGVCSATRSSQILGVMQTSFGNHNHRSSRDNAAGTKHGGIGMIHLPDGVKTLPELFRDAGYFTFNESGKDDYNFVWDAASLYSPGSGKGRWANRGKDQPFFGQLQLKGGKLGGKAKTVIDRNTVPVPPYYPDIELVREEIAHHYDCILTTDEHVGEILTALEHDGLRENTYVFLHSDHGYKLHRHKQFLYEGGIHMPLIVSGPRVPAGTVRDDLISGVDLAPASLAAAGLPVPGYMEGADFLGKEYAPRAFLVAARDRCDYTIEKIRAIVTPRFKYLRNYLTDRPFMQPSYKDAWPVSQKFREMMANGEMTATQLVFFGPTKPAEELYDLTNDPHEVYNLAGDAKFAGELERHRKLLASWIKDTGDKGQPTESDDGLLQTYYRWKEKCVNPEYDRIRHLAVPKPEKPGRKRKK